LEAWIRKRAGWLYWSVFAMLVLALAYGAIRHPDAPIRECGNSYCGKYGALHTAEEYREFVVWETTFKIVGCVTFLSVLLRLWVGGPRRNES
jgi:hypothetical protein